MNCRPTKWDGFLCRQFCAVGSRLYQNPFEKDRILLFVKHLESARAGILYFVTPTQCDRGEWIYFTLLPHPVRARRVDLFYFVTPPRATAEISADFSFSRSPAKARTYRT